MMAAAEFVKTNMNKNVESDELIIVRNEFPFQNFEKRKGAVGLMITTIADITERKKDEEYLGHLGAIVESSEDAIISKTLDGTIKSWNRSSEKMFGYTALQAIGKNISLIIPPEYVSEEKQIVERIRNNETIRHYETVRLNRNGEQLYVSLTVSPLKNRAGRIIGVSKIARNITSRKETETELIRANKELIFQSDEKEKRAAELFIADKERIFQDEEREKRAAELIIANRELLFQNEEKEKRAAELLVANKELEQFAYIASHDLQEPLRTISNYMQVFEEDYLEVLDDNARKYIRSVNDAAKRMSLLVHALLDFSRLGRDKTLTYVDCKKLVEDVIADLRSLITDSNTNISVAEMPSLNVYEIEMGQIFQNLITNAIKFRKKNSSSEIQIGCKRVKDKWQFSVSDNGIGIAPNHFHRIFDIFQRLHTTNEYQGYGIGLANCKKIITLHQGEIWIESTLGGGSTFNFTIPKL